MNTDHCYSVFLVDLGQFGDAEWWWGRVREGKEGGRRDGGGGGEILQCLHYIQLRKTLHCPPLSL